jgi:hypothetical protein
MENRGTPKSVENVVWNQIRCYKICYGRYFIGTQSHSSQVKQEKKNNTAPQRLTQIQPKGWRHNGSAGQYYPPTPPSSHSLSNSLNLSQRRPRSNSPTPFPYPPPSRISLRKQPLTPPLSNPPPNRARQSQRSYMYIHVHVHVTTSTDGLGH